MLEERRSGTRLKLQQVLVNSAMYDSSDCRCGWADEYAFAYVALLEREILLPKNLLSQSIAHVMQRAEQMDDPTPPQHDFSCEQAKGHRKPIYRERCSQDLKQLRKHVGLCIDGLWRGSTTANLTCRIQQ